MERRNTPPKGMSKEEKNKGDWDYAYKYTNSDIHQICGTETIQTFVELQQLKWIAHVIRMDNSALEKQTLFMEGTPDIWKKIEERLMMDRSQLLRIMFNKKTFDGWLRNLKKQL